MSRGALLKKSEKVIVLEVVVVASTSTSRNIHKYFLDKGDAATSKLFTNMKVDATRSYKAI